MNSNNKTGKRKSQREIILDYLQSQNHHCPPKKIKEALGINHVSSVNTALSALLKEGAVSRKLIRKSNGGIHYAYQHRTVKPTVKSAGLDMLTAQRNYFLRTLPPSANYQEAT